MDLAESAVWHVDLVTWDDHKVLAAVEAACGLGVTRDDRKGIVGKLPPGAGVAVSAPTSFRLHKIHIGEEEASQMCFLEVIPTRGAG